MSMMDHDDLAEEMIEEKQRKSWVPRVITGGKGPPDGSSHDWLSELPLFTTFTCRHRNNQDVDLNLYCVMFKAPNVVLLAWRLPDGKVLDYHVDPVRFSKKFENVTVLGVLPVAEEQEEDNDGTGQRNQDRSSDVGVHEAVQGVDQVVPQAEQPDLPD